MSTLPNTVKDIDLLKWVVANPNNPFDPNMLVSATHTTDWQWQAVGAQMAELKRLGYINQIKQDPGGSTYWTIASKGENYLRELERAEKAVLSSNIQIPVSSEAEPVGDISPIESDVAPPVLAKQFGATRIAVRRTTSLTFSLHNPNSTSLTDISFDDPLPAGLVISEPNGLLGNYGGGHVNAPARGNVIRLSGASLKANEACSFTVNITAVDAGTKNNFTSAVSFREGNPAAGASASLVVMGDGSPTSLAEQLALRLMVRRPNEQHAAMASLFAPGFAITSLGAVSTLSLVPNAEESIEVESVHSSSAIKSASVVWIDESKDLAVLQLPVEAQLPLPEDLLTTTGVITSGKWESYISLPGRGNSDVYGKLGELATIEGREYQILVPNSPIGDSTALWGAPVVVDGKLVGIIAESTEGGTFLYASIFSRATLENAKRSTIAPPPQSQSSSTMAGYNSDDPVGEDLLDVVKDVNGLASVLAAKKVDPPLSLGLFGDWGTGKSFFMRCLEGRIRELADDAKQAGGGSQYCQDIVQLSFNAWNYIDKDLWASLASEIFEGLATALAKKRGGDSKEGRALALAAASSSVDVVAEAERQRNEAEVSLKESEQQLEQLQRSQYEIKPNLSTREVLKQAARFAIRDESVQKQVQDAASEIGISKGVAAVGEIRTQILDLDNVWAEIVFTLRNNRNLGVWGIALLVAWGVAWGATSLVRRYTTHDFVTSIVGVFTAVSGFLTAFLTGSRKVLGLVRKINASRQELIKKTQSTVSDKIGKAQEKVTQAAEKLKALNQQLENMRADRQMVDFIRQRYESSDYRNSLGTIARVRADFKHLSALLRDVQQESEKDMLEMKGRQQDKELERRGRNEPPLFPRIDRIILYIDDLDRCPEKNVFEVLQAVHLLLAFPLFVVVVGVDPRWLLRSLKQQTLFSGEVATEESEAREEVRQWESTPMNYLEKIFQIPFTLRPINKAGFGKLVDKFAKPSTTPADGLERAEISPQSVEKQVDQFELTASSSRESPPASVNLSAEVPQRGETGVVSTDVFAAAQRAGESSITRNPMSHVPEPIDRNPRHLQIEERERAFMKTLYEFIPSPRAGKRVINIYRLLRASVDPAEFSAFIGNDASGEYQCALLLLGILTGFPEEATEILEALIRDRPNGTWGEFLNSIKSKNATVPNATRRSIEQSSPELGYVAIPKAWNDLFSKLQGITGNINLRPCSTFVKWAPRVARYSFQSGRALLHQRGTGG